LIAMSLAGCDTAFGLGDISVPPDAPALCPAEYTITVPSSESQYRLAPTRTNWTAAMQDCVDDQIGPSSRFTHLVVLGSGEEYTEIVAMAGGPFWIGLTDRATIETFVWVTDEDTQGYPPATGEPWGLNQPDNNGGGCVDVEDTSSLDPGWHDRKCDGALVAYASFCECDPFPAIPSHY
jgi:hypothetical protein